PGEAELEAIVGIGDAEPRAERLEAVGREAGVLLAVGEVDHRGAEYRPVPSESDAARGAQLFAVLQILESQVDVAVETQVAQLQVRRIGADRRVDLVAAHRETVLVDAVAMREPDEIAIANLGPAHPVRELLRQPGPFG